MIYKVTASGMKKLQAKSDGPYKAELVDNWKAPPKRYEVASKEDRKQIIDFLKMEMEQDALNHQMMLNVVDLTTLTKAKITALGKLGESMKKESKALIKKYESAEIKFHVKERTWLNKNSK